MSELLAIIPHPDDECYSFAATIAAAALSGWRCSILCVSDGERGQRYGVWPLDRRPLGAVRRDELARSSRLLGAGEPRFLGLPDGAVGACSDLAEILAGAIAEGRPRAILSLGADGAYGHPDHVAVHRAVVEAWRSLRSPGALLFSAFPPGLFAPQWRRCRKMLGDPPRPPLSALGTEIWHYELRCEGLRGRKREAIAAHRSQLPGGDPDRLFPSGIIPELESRERFVDASAGADPEVLAWFACWQKAASAR